MSSLLAIKLHRPFLPPQHVPRPRLLQRLNGGLTAGRPLTLVSAPAGFGKTLCVSEWVGALDLPVAWLSLDPADDDPGRFFTYLVAALQSIDPNIGRAIEPVLRSGQLPPGEILHLTLVNDLAEVERRFVLVLDDFHIIQDELIVQVLDALIANPPPALHLVLLTREDPPLPLARLRAHNRLTEIRAGDLRFCGPEAGQFLNGSMALGLSPADTAVLEERTEGWIAGLQLAALALQSPAAGPTPADPSAFIAHLSGSHRYILGYLTEEVLSRQPAEIQSFLLQTAILERLSGDLCDAVTRRTGSGLLLEQLFAANLFLVPLDNERRWYRYHHLFADLLRDLQTTLPGDEISALHRRAAHWYAQAGLISEAIWHALAAGDYAAAVQWIESHAMDMLMQWHVKTVDGWMQAIPAEWIAHSPRANLAFAWMHLIRGNFPQAAPYLERLYSLFSNPEHIAEIDPALEARWLALQAMLLNAQGRPAESLELGRRALEIAPAADLLGRCQIYLGLAGAYQQLDDFPQTVEAFQHILQHSRAAGHTLSEMLGVSALALLLIQRGRLRRAYDLVTQAVEKMERLGALPPISTALYGELGALHYNWFELEAAHRYYQRAIQVSALSGYPDAEMYYGVVLSQLAHMAGDQAAAAREIQRAVELMQREGAVAVREEVVAQQVRIALAQGDDLQAEAALRPHGFVFTGGFAYPELKPGLIISIASHTEYTRPSGLLYLSALRLLLYRARNEAAGGLERGLALADRLIAELLPRGYVPFVIETLLLRAQMHAVLGNDAAQVADVAQALELAAPDGIISPFVETGPPLAAALIRLRQPDRPAAAAPEFLHRVWDAFIRTYPSTAGEPPSSGTGVELIEPLTDRERDVLRGMAAGLKYEEIAAQLFISLNTVRSHVKAVYGKLNVNNRTQALAAARRLDLL